MAHYAFLDSDNIVTEVIVGIDENETIDGKSPEIWYSEFRNQRCVRTSYNGKIRKNYAGIGFYYDDVKDAFIPRKNNCHIEEYLDQELCQWKCENEDHTKTL